MSSFIGHGLAGITTYTIGQKIQTNRQPSPIRQQQAWLLYLIFVASVPDLDYLIPALKLHQAGQILRITHSAVGVLLVPVCTIIWLRLSGNRGKSFQLQIYQLLLVGLSHLGLDLLTGVFPEPLLYPFSTQTFRLPFGLLPSAGKIQLTNYLFYRNIFIEMGVLLPLAMSLTIGIGTPIKSIVQQMSITVCILVSGIFMLWAASLSR